ncbi:MAG TPA: DUF3892 domain-containing protein [Candidatus Eremiobacteraceae bacterium]|nr:DUF3892 domain-containing protein [Candidatus Eremiobacteraceae bacterium]
MPLKCIARRMAPSGQRHEHISNLWTRDNDGAGPEAVRTRAEMVTYVEQHGDESVWCPDRDPARKSAWVHVNHIGDTKYVQTYADGRWSDNLLSLPER